MLACGFYPYVFRQWMREGKRKPTMKVTAREKGWRKIPKTLVKAARIRRARNNEGKVHGLQTQRISGTPVPISMKNQGKSRNSVISFMPVISFARS